MNFSKKTHRQNRAVAQTQKREKTTDSRRPSEPFGHFPKPRLSVKTINMNNTIAAPDAKYAYASLWNRFFAMIIDCIILSIPSAVIGHLLPGAGAMLIWVFYGSFMESSSARATFGKFLLGVQVSDFSGNRITFKAALIRNLMTLVSAAILMIGYVIALFNDRKQTLHDIVADTVVINGKSGETLGSVWNAWIANIRMVFGATESGIANSENTLSQLERLEALRKNGSLTEEEFQAQKKKILSL